MKREAEINGEMPTDTYAQCKKLRTWQTNWKIRTVTLNGRRSEKRRFDYLFVLDRDFSNTWNEARLTQNNTSNILQKAQNKYIDERKKEKSIPSDPARMLPKSPAWRSSSSGGPWTRFNGLKWGPEVQNSTTESQRWNTMETSIKWDLNSKSSLI